MLRRIPSREQQTGAEPSPPTVLESAFRLHQAGHAEEALRRYIEAIELDPASEVARNLMGTLLCSLGRLVEGEACFTNVIETNPFNVEALNNLAGARKDQGDLSSAENLYRRTVELRPEFTTAWTNLGSVYAAQGRPTEAERCFRHVLLVDGESAEAHCNLAAALRSQDRFTEAEAEFHAAIAANPAFAAAWCGLGGILPFRGLLDEAEACCKRALELRPDYPDATNNLASVAKARGRLDAAKTYCDDVLRVYPNHVAALNNLGSIAGLQGDLITAEGTFRAALRIDPGRGVTQYNLATTLLMLGDYVEGFELYESRFEVFRRSLTRSPALDDKLRSRQRWRGEVLHGGRLLVWAEQGLGDSIMMLRYLRRLNARGLSLVTVLCDASLKRLVGAMSVAERVITLEEADERLEFDVHCPIMSLPLALDSHLETIPVRVPYLDVPQAMIGLWNTRLLDARPKVGIAWAGSKTLQDDKQRSIPLEQLMPLLSIGGIKFVSLQTGGAGDEWHRTGLDGGQYIGACHDFLDTAALVMNLDLVISVDTAVTHLAGALGRPVWLLNRFGSEWRWGLKSETSAWYPTLRIFRQPSPSNWDPVIERLSAELKELTL